MQVRRVTSRRWRAPRGISTRTCPPSSEDIEIRSLWIDGYDDLVLAGSSWGNPTSRSPYLPSFFVLRLTR